MSTFPNLMKLTPKTYMGALLLVLAGAGIVQHGFQAVYLQLTLAVSVAIALDVIISWAKAKRFVLPSSAFITGLIIAMVLSPNINWHIPIIATSIAILQKHFLRYPAHKPIFNPAALGLLAVVLLFHANINWWGQSLWWLVIIAGLFISYKTKKLTIPIAFIISAAVVFALGFYLKDKFWINPLLYINFFFVFVMLIEPKTSPYGSKSQCIYAASAAILSYLFFLISPQYDFSVIALVITNLLMSFVFTWQIKKLQS